MNVGRLPRRLPRRLPHSAILRLRQVMPLLVVALWGSAVYLVALAMRDVGPMAAALWRWLLALVPLWGVVLAAGKGAAAWESLRRHPWDYVILGIFGFTLLYGTQNLALNYTTLFNTSFLINLTPIFVVVLAVIWLRERPRWSVIAGIGLGLMGAVALSGGQLSEVRVTSQTWRGDLLAATSALSAAVYIVYSKRMLAFTPPLVLLALGVTCGVVSLAPLVAIEGDFWPQQPLTWISLLLLGLGAGALGNLWWQDMLSTTPASRVGLYLYGTALVGALLAVLVVGEPLTIWIALGGALILAGVWLVQR